MIDLLVIQPTPFCNINCSYCYLPDRSNPERISLHTLQTLADRLLECIWVQDELSIAFHSGEPLVPGVDFYREMLQYLEERLKAKGIRTRYSLQTNGTLLSEAWCTLIKEYDIRIGISIDGPAFLNDAHRLSRSGKSTFEQTMQGIRLLQAHQIPYHGIAVVSEQSLPFATELFDFFYGNGFYSLGINIEEQEGVHSSSSLFATAQEEKISLFYKQLLQALLRSDGHMEVREFSKAMGAMLREPEQEDINLLPTSNHQLEPMRIVSVDHKGNFSTFSPELIGQKNALYDNFLLGNIHDCSFQEATRSGLFNRMLKEIQAGAKKCRDACPYFALCGGGAPANKLYENGSFDSTETQYCRYQIQLPIDLALEHLEERFAS